MAQQALSVVSFCLLAEKGFVSPRNTAYAGKGGGSLAFFTQADLGEKFRDRRCPSTHQIHRPGIERTNAPHFVNNSHQISSLPPLHLTSPLALSASLLQTTKIRPDRPTDRTVYPPSQHRTRPYSHSAPVPPQYRPSNNTGLSSSPIHQPPHF